MYNCHHKDTLTPIHNQILLSLKMRTNKLARLKELFLFCSTFYTILNRGSSREWDRGVTLQMEMTKIIYHDHTSYGWGSLWYGSRGSAQLSCWDSNFGFFNAVGFLYSLAIFYKIASSTIDQKWGRQEQNKNLTKKNGKSLSQQLSCAEPRDPCQSDPHP